jgi:hypothetical protein
MLKYNICRIALRRILRDGKWLRKDNVSELLTMVMNLVLNLSSEISYKLDDNYPLREDIVNNFADF